MFLSYWTLVVALSLSLVAAWYSIAGLTAIFAAAAVPIIIMGGIMEVAKITVTVWLHEYWQYAKRSLKVQLSASVVLLMFITSMGIFGFLSKAHTDQALVSGDVGAKIAIYDEKIKIAKDNIEANRRALTQMDAAVDQTMSRSNDEKGADKAVAIRRSQQAERGRLLKEIEAEQKKIAALNDEAAPIRAEVRKVEAEVGPIKYIAALIYGDSPDTNVLEKAVRWVIIILVIVFDPLAIAMVLSATESLKWEKQWRASLKENNNGTGNDDGIPTPENMDGYRAGNDSNEQPPPVLDVPVEPQEPEHVDPPIINEVQPEVQPVVEEEDTDNAIKQAKKEWKVANPDNTIHRQERLLKQGKIDQLPWEEQLKARPDGQNFPNISFGVHFPETANKGDAYIRVDYLPTKLFKFNGSKWIEVDKNTTNTYAYNDNYIDHLIAKIGSGEYDPELLSDNEREQVEQRLHATTNNG